MAKIDSGHIRWVSSSSAPLTSNKVLGADLVALGLGSPGGAAVLCQSLDRRDPQLSLLRIAGGKAEEAHPVFFALLFGVVVLAAHYGAPVWHGELDPDKLLNTLKK